MPIPLISSSLILAIALLWLVVVSCALLWYQQRQHARWAVQRVRYCMENVSEKSAERQHWLARIGRRYPASAAEKQRLLKMLAQAGIDSDDGVARVCGAKCLSGMAAVVVALVWRWQGELTAMLLMALLFAYVLGANLPEYWLRRRSLRVREQQRRAVPDAIDMLVITVEAGLSLDRALERVGRYLQASEPRLAEQFLRTHAEVQVMGDPAQCMKKLAWRTGLPELERLASTLAMAQRYGSPLADTMRTISKEARQMRKIALEEQAGKLPGRITLIQMGFIMLPLLVLIIAPTLNLLIESLSE
ncbi:MULTISPECIES: type II secretion system F family protein [Photobacterium]|uniref:Type II secretion system F family protein n=1 Tax=Photobacterium arenosum TaxID=2774143 RepID=A0ABR9BLL2_9GAMM|nr:MULTISPECIES: type II secretion system F family protein [Photobacterium]MBD8513459.1 type II secretion system F family protein [Photobacterium arenosum]MDO6582228.1 type II secretion system F family protein [Photobacterium sp. 2_MG-2023]